MKVYILVHGGLSVYGISTLLRCFRWNTSPLFQKKEKEKESP
jgi:hypothetical protein